MKSLVVLFSMILISGNALAGEWVQISKDTLTFKGAIESSDLEKFKTAFSPEIKKIIVDSGGGDAEVGLSIGEIISNADVSIEVQGICVSSCANYLFTAGKHKILNQGIVGYHGNMTALLNSMSKEEFLNQMKKYGASDEQANEVYSHFISEVLPRENSFFAKLGISQDLFNRTQREDKGMGSGTYSALLPKAETFLKYGILNVSGEQSQFVIEHDPRVTKYADLGAPVVVD